MKWHFKQLAAPIVALTMLGGIMADRAMFHEPQGDAEPYKERVRLALNEAPYTIGEWVGTDVPVPAAAQRMLKPNAMISRRYEQVITGQEAILVIVHCADARDLLGHYPPVCYPSHGWQQLSAQHEEWQVADRTIHGTQYEFIRQDVSESSHMAIFNFMVLPGGGTSPDMDAINSIAQDHTRRFYGAAQVQVVLSGRAPDSVRHTIFKRLMEANLHVIDAIQTTTDPEQLQEPSQPAPIVTQARAH